MRMFGKPSPAQVRDQKMRELLSITRAMCKATTNYEKRHLIVKAEHLQAEIKEIDGAELFVVV